MPATTVRTRQKARRARRARRRMPATCATNGLDCITCHAKAATSFTSWAGRRLTSISRPTRTARTATTARRRPAMTTPPHIPVTGVQCSNCHTNTATSFTTYTMNHAAVSASRCDTCHNGSYTSQGPRAPRAQPRIPATSPPRPDCSPVTSATTGFTSWAGGTYVHQPADTNCSTCHNGTTATGMTTPPHIPVSGVQCSNCHTNTATSFTTYTMNHAAVSASRAIPATTAPTPARGQKVRTGTASYRQSRSDQRPGLRHLPCQRGHDLHKLGRRYLHPPAERHQLLDLPQRHHSGV